MGWRDRIAARFDEEGRRDKADWEHLADAPDTWADLHDQFSRPELAGRQFVALSSEGNVVVSSHRQHVLLLGPTQVGKSSGTLVPNVLCAPGPVVSASVKPDVYQATAQSRSRLGRLWHFNIAGDDPLPGCTPLRWSPITDAADWTTAGIIAEAMVGAAEVAAGTDDANYFRQRAADLIAPLLHAAALAGRDMRWVRDGVLENAAVLGRAEDILSRSDSPFTYGAGAELGSIARLDSRSRSAIFSTASTALRAYRYEGPLATTRDPNFDPDAFVAGSNRLDEPGLERFTPEDHDRLARIRDGARMSMAQNVPMGSYDTIYITADSKLQALVPSIITGLLARIRQARYALTVVDKRQKREGRPHTLWVLDEMSNIAPLRDLPSTLSQAAGQGLLIMGVLQDLSQARAKWGEEGDGFLTHFGDKVIYRGIDDAETLRHLSTVFGKSWVRRETYSEQTGTAANPVLFGGTRVSSYNTGTSVNETEQLLPNMDEAEISDVRLRDEPPQDRRRVLIRQSSGGRGFAYCAPYYNTSPFMEAVIDSATFLAFNGSAFEQRARLDVPDMPTLEQPHLQEQWDDATRQLRTLRSYNSALAPWLNKQWLFDDLDKTEAGMQRSLRSRLGVGEEAIFLAGMPSTDWLWEQFADLQIARPPAPPARINPEPRARPVEWGSVAIEKFHMSVHVFSRAQVMEVVMDMGRLDRLEDDAWRAACRQFGWAIVLSHEVRAGSAVATALVRRLAERTGEAVWHCRLNRQLWRTAPDGQSTISPRHVHIKMLGEDVESYFKAHPEEEARYWEMLNADFDRRRSRQP